MAGAVEGRPSTFQWFEPAVGMVVTVDIVDTTGDIDAASVEEFIDGLRVADQDELDELLDTYGIPAEDARRETH